MVTVLLPSSPEATWSPDSDTVIDTEMSSWGAGVAVSVNEAAVPSVTAAAPAAMLITGLVSSSVIRKLALPVPLAPPPSPVPELAFKAPRPTVTVSEAPSSRKSPVASSVTVAVAEALARPVNVMVGGSSDRSVLARLE